jgi:glycosyltransferase involved in cell wall biosynthesis
MIKIAFVIDTIESPTAGTEKQLLLLIKYLDRTKFKPYLCVLRTSVWLNEEFSECPLFEVGINSFKSPKSYLNIFRFGRFLKEESIDLVQTHFRDANFAGIIAAKLAGVKKIIGTRRNQGYWMNGTEFFFQKILNRWVDVIVVNSESTKRWVLEKESFPDNQIMVIHNGLELDRFSVELSVKKSVRNQLGIADSAIAVVIVANLRPVKGIDIFIQSAALVLGKYPEACFYIIGEGKDRGNLEKLSRHLGIADSIIFLGRQENVYNLLPAFDIGVLTSHSESFSNSIIEYLASGLPVVCTDVGGAREAVQDGVNGFVVNPGDSKALFSKIQEIILNGTCEDMGGESRKKAQDFFSHQNMVCSTETFYLKVFKL